MLVNRILKTNYLFSYFVHKGEYLIPNPPKRSITAYLIFSNDVREKLRNEQGKDAVSDVASVAKIAGERWKSIT